MIMTLASFLMMVWGPGMRDRAMEGLSILARREVWRTSEQGGRITSRIEAALADDSPVVRMHAAEAITGLHTDATSEERVAVLRDLLINESHVMVNAALLSALGREAHVSPVAVDTALKAVADQTTSVEQSTVSDTPTEDEDNEPEVHRAEEERIGLKVEILTLLALTYQTPFATWTLKQWASTPAQSKELNRAIPLVRGYLAPDTEPQVQQRAFEFVATAAASAHKHWTHTQEQLGDVTEPTAVQQSELKNVLRVLDKTASQIYFASGAFESKRATVSDDERPQAAPTKVELARFAERATPTLLTCSATKAAPVIHHVVETLVYLAPFDEKRGLKALAEAVTANTNYAYDTLSGGVVIPYLTRLLAEQRDLVLFDVEGVTAFRTLLSAFATAGNEDALVLAFTFADVFR